MDAAANAWSARCLAATGTDSNGAPWPILYSRGFGENQSTLYYYLLLPFQALFGMSAWSTALPSVVGGAASVFFAFVLGKRLFDPATGLAAAAILAASPWHLLLSRWGHDSGVVPLLVLAPLAMFSASGLPLGDRSPGAPRIGTAAAAARLPRHLLLRVLRSAAVPPRAPPGRDGGSARGLAARAGNAPRPSRPGGIPPGDRADARPARREPPLGPRDLEARYGHAPLERERWAGRARRQGARPLCRALLPRVPLPRGGHLPAPRDPRQRTAPALDASLRGAGRVFRAEARAGPRPARAWSRPGSCYIRWPMPSAAIPRRISCAALLD